MSFQNQIIAAMIAVLFILVPFESVQARVLIKETTNYYNIQGKKAGDVYRQIDRKGLKSHGVKHAVAVTKILLSIDGVDLIRKGRSCSVKNVRVRLKLAYTYPRWINSRKGSRDARKKWKAYFRRVVRHEKRHGTIAKNMAKDLNRSIQKLRGRSPRQCFALPRTMRRLFKQINRKYDRQQQVFDKREHRRNSKIMKLARSFAFSK